MSLIKISNGEAQIKDFCSRKLAKKINEAMWDGENGITPLGMNKSSDVALVGMVDKLVVDGKDMTISVESFDEMDTRDVDAISAEIEKVTKKQTPKA